MIYIDKPIKAYVSKIEQKGKLTLGSVSTSRKDKQKDEWIKSYWNARFPKAVPVEGKIEILKAMLVNEKADNGKYYVNLIVLEFQQENGFAEVPEGEMEDDLPF